MALAERAPKLMADTLNADMEYGCLQSGPPTVTRKSVSLMCEGDMEWLIHS
ncbi:hypothetical protein D3C73_1389740 [compost metagenome]